MSGRAWALALLPLVLLAALLGWIVKSRPTEALREGVPPVEALAISRAVLSDGEILLSVLNDGPDPVTVAQVQVDDAYWAFTQEPAGALGRLGRAEVRIPYPWVHGETHVVKLVTSTGLTFEHEIAVAFPTPQPSGRFFGLFALVGLYVGVIPVVLGLLWYPLAGRLGPRAMDFLLALTIGLLLFLLVDSLHEGAEMARELPGAFQGMALLALGFGVAYLALEGARGVAARARRRPRRGVGRRRCSSPSASACTTSARAWRSAPPSPSARRRSGRCSSSASRCTTRPRGSPSSRRSRARASPGSGSCCSV